MSSSNIGIAVYEATLGPTNVTSTIGTIGDELVWTRNGIPGDVQRNPAMILVEVQNAGTAALNSFTFEWFAHSSGEWYTVESAWTAANVYAEMAGSGLANPATLASGAKTHLHLRPMGSKFRFRATTASGTAAVTLLVFVPPTR